MLDDLPELVPITTAELDTIQIYLGDLIDRLIADAASSTEAKPVSAPKARKPIGVQPLRKSAGRAHPTLRERGVGTFLTPQTIVGIRNHVRTFFGTLPQLNDGHPLFVDWRKSEGCFSTNPAADAYDVFESRLVSKYAEPTLFAAPALA